MKSPKSARFTFRTLLAAAALGVCAQSVQASTLNYTANDTGPTFGLGSRLRAEIYNIDNGWIYGSPINSPTVTSNITGTQNGSINFLNTRNGQFITSYTGYAGSISASIYQDNLDIGNNLIGGGVLVITIPLVEVRINNFASSSTTYNYYNPDTYAANLILTNAIINGDPGYEAIYTDRNIDSTLNLYGNNTINGATLVDNIYVNYNTVPGSFTNTTFNGDVYGQTILAQGANVTYTNQAQVISGGIYAANSGYRTTLNFEGANTVNGVINMYMPLDGPWAQINIRGKGVVFNGDVTGVNTINFSNGSELSLGNGVIVTSTFINFNGNNATLNVGEGVEVNSNIVTTSVATGTVNFAGSAIVRGELGGSGTALNEVNINGKGSVVRIEGATAAIDVKLNAESTLVLSGGLDSYNQDTDTLGNLSYFDKNSEVQVGDPYYPLATPALNTNISTTKDNNGTLKFLGGVVEVSGSVAKLGYELALIAVGGTNSGKGNDTISNSATAVIFNTDVFAHNVSLNGRIAALVMESGKSIKGTSLTTSITTDLTSIGGLDPSLLTGTNSASVLALNGGTQVADFANIGTSAAKVGFVISGVDGSSASTFTGNVFANNIITYDGVSNFQQGVVADDVSIDSGTINFNAPSGTTPGSSGTIPSGGSTSINNRLTFTNDGTANFYQGANVGTIDFNGYAGTVNVSANKNLVGDVINHDLITIVADGTVNFLGGTSALTGNVGSNVYSIALLHAGKDSQSDLTVTGDIFAVETRLSHNSTLNAWGDITGNVTNSSTVPAGTLNLTRNNQTVNGNIGSTTASLYLVEAADEGDTTTFNGMVYAKTLKYAYDGTVVLNGTNGGGPVGGIVGTVDFDSESGELVIGDGVNLTFSTTAAAFANANRASMYFEGSSTVTGNVGAAGTFSGTNPVAANSTPGEIYAGATGKTVDFLGKVYVSGNTFHVTGLGTVNFSDDLVGPLVFEDDGVVNFANTKGIVGITAGNGTAKLQSPAVDGEGTINFIGSTTQDGELGSFYGDGLNNFDSPFGRLKAVNFHSGTTAANVTQALDYSIYAWYTNIGSTNTIGTNPTTTTAIIGRNPNTGDNIHLGTDVTMASDTTTIYTAGAQSRVDYGRADATLSVDFVHTKHADGTLTLGTIAAPVAITQSVFDANLNTNNGTLGFAISAEPYSNSTVPGTYNGVVAADAALSSSINGEGYYLGNNNRGSYLNMSGNETIQVAFLGSMKDNVSYTVVNVKNNAGTIGDHDLLGVTLIDNSFTIDTTFARYIADNGDYDADLVITTHRDEYTYLTKSGTKLLGLRSYDMAHRLGTLAADGTGYSAGLQVVFNKLDLDQWGYGNNATNLARQLYLLTPSGDGAAVKAGTGLTAQAVGAVLDGSGSLSTRATPQRSYWVRAYGSHDNQSGSGEYAGHNINGGGATVGTDYQIGDSVVGLAVGYGKAKASSSGLREGDKADVDSTIAGLFFRKPIGEYFLNAMIDAAKHRTKTERQTAVGARANGDYTGTEFGGAIQLGRKFALRDTNESLTPILAVNYSRYKQAAYAETGAGDIGLNYTEQKYTQTDATLSLRYAVEKILGEGIASSFSASLGYKHLLSAPTYNNTVNFVGDTNTFDVAGWKETHKGSVTAALAYNYNPSKGVTYTIDYSGEVKSGYNAHSLGFRATWEY